MPKLSMTSDFAADGGSPEQPLRAIARTGFTHVHWCHHWNTDFIYTEPEIDQIARWLEETGLTLVDLHGSSGVEKRWTSRHAWQRLAGVELVRNRIEMTARLGGHAVVMHASPEPDPADGEPVIPQPLRRSLDELQPVAEKAGVRLAIENGDVHLISALLAEYPPSYLGLCYDAGHGTMAGDGLDHLERLADRLIVVHLHDNDGTSDQHNNPFTGRGDWDRLAGILARSPYRGPVTLESNLRGLDTAPEAFLHQAFEAARRLAEMIDQDAGKQT
ncbi:MAG: sugar phosphate isomerase/epimerase family protein [Planctomycetota bacterium]